MLITCISASNIKHAKEYSTSLRICYLIKEFLNNEIDKNLDIQIIPLVDYEFKPCIGCGKCYLKDKCVIDDVFNDVYEKIKKSDGLFIVSAHYAPIPSKLAMLLEKMEQLTFLPRFNDENNKSSLYKKPVGIIGHGGGTEEIIKGYKGVVLNTISNALGYPIEMKIIGVNEQWPNGIAVPIKKVINDPISIFPIQVYDWEDIKNRIKPLIINVTKELGCNKYK